MSGEYLFSLFLVNLAFLAGDGDLVCSCNIFPGDMPNCREALREILCVADAEVPRE